MDFKTSYLRLEEICAIIKNNSILDIDELIQLQEEAKSLYEYLTHRLSEKHV